MFEEFLKTYYLNIFILLWKTYEFIILFNYIYKKMNNYNYEIEIKDFFFDKRYMKNLFLLKILNKIKNIKENNIK